MAVSPPLVGTVQVRLGESPVTTDAAPHFAQLGMQNYVGARFAARAGLMPTTGSYFHHAVEMFLKAQLTRRGFTLEQVKKIGHSLGRNWAEFKALFPTEQLSGFDQLVADLDRWEEVRYPDSVIKNGMAAQIDWSPGGTPLQLSGPAPFMGQARYELHIPGLDRLIVKIVQLSGLNARALVPYLLRNQAGLDALLYHNAEAAFWQE